MGRDWWEHLQVDAPAARVAGSLPLDAAAGRSRLEVRHERTAEGAFWGARRFRAVWSHGSRGGRADVEIRPQSSWSSEIVLRLEPPGGFPPWGAERLAGRARELALALRRELSRAVAAPAVDEPEQALA